MRLKVGVLLICAVLVFGIMLAAASCAAGPATTGPIKWKAQNALALTSYQYIYQFKPFVDMVKDQSNGRLTIELFAPGAIVDAYEQFAALQKGAIDVAMGVGGYNIKQVPEGDIEQGLPGTFASEDDFFDCYMNYKGGEFYKILEAAYREKGAQLLKSHGPSTQSLISRQPIKTADELKGKKMRASGAYVELVKNLGGAPVTLAPAEVFMALQTGTVDGVFFPTYTIGTMRLWDVGKGILMPSIGQTAGDILVNAKAYDALPGDLKDIVNQAAEAAAYTYNAAQKERTKTLVDTAIKQYGVTLVTLPDSEFNKIRKAAEPIIDTYAKATPRSAQLVALIREYIATKK